MTNIDLTPILRKRLEIIGTVMRTRSSSERIELIRDFVSQGLPGFRDGTLNRWWEPCSRSKDLARAHETMERDETFGKIVLEW